MFNFMITWICRVKEEALDPYLTQLEMYL